MKPRSHGTDCYTCEDGNFKHLRNVVVRCRAKLGTETAHKGA
jgi:hypothetical protein